MKEIIVPLIMYEAADGERFDNPEDAIHYELIKSGVRRVCPACEGTEMVLSYNMLRREHCSECSSKGYQEKIEVWK